MSNRDLKELDSNLILPGRTRSSSRRVTEEESQLINTEISADFVPIEEPTGEQLDLEEIISNLEQSIYSVNGDIDTAFRIDSESDRSTSEDNPINTEVKLNNQETEIMSKEEELKKLSEEYIRARNDSEREAVQKKVSEGDTLQFLIEVTKNQNLDSNVKRKLLEGISTAVKGKTPAPLAAGTSQSFNQVTGMSNQWQANNIGYKRDVPLFHGKEEEDYNQWSNTIKLNNEMNNYSDRDAAYAIGNKLKGAPVYYYQEYMEKCRNNETIPSWREIDRELRETYTNEAKQ